MFKFEQFAEEVFSVLEEDSVANSRAISTNEASVNSPDEIDALFDSIAYGKGGCLIRMMNYIMGENTFSTGIRVNIF
jgi:aminopeptidase N